MEPQSVGYSPAVVPDFKKLNEVDDEESDPTLKALKYAQPFPYHSLPACSLTHTFTILSVLLPRMSSCNVLLHFVPPSTPTDSVSDICALDVVHCAFALFIAHKVFVFSPNETHTTDCLSTTSTCRFITLTQVLF